MSRTPLNKSMDANRRAVLSLVAKQKFGRAVHAPLSLSVVGAY
jgi:hypothetical protein